MMEKSALDRKHNGIHYTPLPLAKFLADQIWDVIRPEKVGKELRVLDPACGDGQLLTAIGQTVGHQAKLELVGFETDAAAAESARLSVGKFGPVQVYCEDFLDCVEEENSVDFDIVISNPPYVRTQNIGATRIEKIREQYHLTGRIDLYQAFCVAMSRKLKPGGTLGLLTSNRFMYVRSGRTMRHFLYENFCLQRIFDLGDSKQFSAAVLPVVVIATKTDEPVRKQNCPFVRIQSQCSNEMPDSCSDGDFFACLAEGGDQFVSNNSQFSVEKGLLNASDSKQPWSIINDASQQFLGRISSNKTCAFTDMAEIKVGIKTTADSVFIREDWERISDRVPESALLKPLITHHVCNRWRSPEPRKRVLYPYGYQQKRKTVDLDDYPKCKSYLLQHYEQLSGRQYLMDAGRDWFEIWVPQQPRAWTQPKIVWPDISEQPTFSFDESGAIVNGDCYWIKLKPDVEPDWLYLMLGVANSSVAEQFYDFMFHNKLYARRRRFMTQYVNQFPLPDLARRESQEIVRLSKIATKSLSVTSTLEHEIDDLVSSALL